MVLQGSGCCVKLSSGIHTTRDIHGYTPLRMFFSIIHVQCTNAPLAEYLAITSIYTYLPDVNRRFSTRGVVYRPNKKIIKCYVDSDFASGQFQSDADNAEIFMSRIRYVIMYTGCPLLWCSKLQMEISLSKIESEYIALNQEMRDIIPFMVLMK